MSDFNTQEKNTKQQTLNNTPPCLVVIRDSLPQNTTNNNDRDDISVFPPHDHENLHRPTQEQQQQHSVTSPSSPLDFNSWDPPESSPPPSPSDVVRRESGVSLFGVALRVLKTRFFRVVSKFWCEGWGNWAVWACGLTLVWWVFVRRRRKRMVVEPKNDEKIIQLLNQIAKMNELLLAHHKVSIPKNCQ